jgi:hypothetical protein
MLSSAITFESLQPIAWRGSEIAQRGSCVEVSQLATSDQEQVRGKALQGHAVKSGPRSLVPEALYHHINVSYDDTLIKLMYLSMIHLSTGRPEETARAKKLISSVVSI